MNAAFAWIIRAYNVAPYQHVWDVGILGPPVILILTFFATVFFLFSVTTRNPTLVGMDALHHDVGRRRIVAGTADPLFTGPTGPCRPAGPRAGLCNTRRQR